MPAASARPPHKAAASGTCRDIVSSLLRLLVVAVVAGMQPRPETKTAPEAEPAGPFACVLRGMGLPFAPDHLQARRFEGGRPGLLPAGAELLLGLALGGGGIIVPGLLQKGGALQIG